MSTQEPQHVYIPKEGNYMYLHDSSHYELNRENNNIKLDTISKKPIVKNLYKNSLGVRYLKGLFFEQTNADKDTVLYTLKDQDHKGFPSLYQLYMNCDDPTEYEFANKYLDGWGHWTILCKCSWFQSIIKRWRKELELRQTAASLRIIKEEASSKGSKYSFQANKFLIERGWVEKQTKGRPSTNQVLKAAKDQAEEEDMLKQDLLRLGDDYHD